GDGRMRACALGFFAPLTPFGAPPRRERPQSQGVELDEAARVAVIIGDRAFLQSDELLVVKREWAFASDGPGGAFIKLERPAAGDGPLTLVDQRLEHLALRREPEAVVDELGISRHDLILEM